MTARSRYLGHHNTLYDNGGPFTPRAGASDSSSTLLVQAVPHASRLRQMACEQGSGDGRCFHPPGICIVVCGPMLVCFSKLNLNGVVYNSFVALLLPCLVCVALL
jgi:hypothetical protein